MDHSSLSNQVIRGLVAGSAIECQAEFLGTHEVVSDVNLLLFIVDISRASLVTSALLVPRQPY